MDVPKNAEVITMGFSVYGNGLLSMDDLSFETVDESHGLTLEGPLSDTPGLVFPEPPQNPLDVQVTIRVKNAPLSIVFDAVSAQSKLNFVLRDQISKMKVTTFNENVSVREFLDILASLKGLTWTRVANSKTYIVSRRENTNDDIDAIAKDYEALKKELKDVKRELRELKNK